MEWYTMCCLITSLQYFPYGRSISMGPYPFISLPFLIFLQFLYISPSIIYLLLTSLLTQYLSTLYFILFKVLYLYHHETVSYTHLDVYKRQVHDTFLIISFLSALLATDILFNPRHFCFERLYA